MKKTTPRPTALSVLALFATCTLATLVTALAQPQDPVAPPAPPATVEAAPSPPAVQVVAPVDLVIKLEREGRLDSARKQKVRLIPEAMGGSFEVAEVLVRSGRVNQGDTLLRLDGEALEKEITAASMAHAHARKRLEIAREESRIQKEDNATRIEQAQKAKDKAERELGIWEKYDSPDMLKSSELSMQQREFSLADQKQELAQLEAMYSGTHLAGETKDIVLDRARRGVMMGEQWLILQKNDETIVREHRHPQQDLQVRDSLRWVSLDFTHAAINVALAEQRKAMELESAEKALRDAEEKLAKLEADRALLVVTAPASGIMTRIDLEPRDTVSARQNICEILDPAKIEMKINATADDLRVLQSGSTLSSRATPEITVDLPEYPEVKVRGRIVDVALVGVAADKATHFPVTVAIEGESPLLRLGLRGRATASATLPGVLAAPKSAIEWRDGKAYCSVRANGETKEREIITGASGSVDGKDMIAIISGVQRGEEIVLKDAK